MLGNKSKMWICLIVGVAWIALKYFDMVPEGFDTVVTDVAVTALQGAGVYQVTNT